jgi:Holliday junction resolvase RusA-like endonuclease
MKTLSFVVPGAPVPCARARVVRSRRRDALSERVHAFTPPKTEAYEQLVAYHARAAMGAQRWKRFAAGPFRVELTVYRVALRGDIDNYSKAALDAMNRADVWVDDRQVDELLVRLRLDRDNPRLEVAVMSRSPG